MDELEKLKKENARLRKALESAKRWIAIDAYFESMNNDPDKPNTAKVAELDTALNGDE